MLPLHLVLGLVAGAVIRDRASLKQMSVVGAASALAWGVLVGIDQTRFSVFAGGSLLALANFCVGVLVSGVAVAIVAAVRR